MAVRSMSAEEMAIRHQQLSHQRAVEAAKTEFSKMTEQDLYALREALVHVTTAFNPIYGQTATGGLEAFAKLSPEEAARLHMSVARDERPEKFRPVFGRLSMGALEAYGNLPPGEAARYHSSVATIFKYRSSHSYAAFLGTDACLEAVVSLLNEKPRQ